ncbi:long-chain acyl-CoA synthetase [Pseudonocardia oroxyli]|uniref:Long-chain acyl-CoA synthetase n=1 Tax=Pseudonocardia oroxyli TaxID=366584 RepID=A0A1G7I6I3_PSEOR|nr:long-chain acyl-CoA synthetase [Pseudonocardia oroxyli]
MAEVAVYGVPHPTLGEEVAVAVRVRPGATGTIEELQHHVAERVATFAVPTHVRFWTEPLPRTATGKPLKRELRDAPSPR